MSGTDLSAHEKRIVENVERHGCHVNFVFDPDENEPAFCYSVGFPETVNQSEVIVFGLSQKMMHWMVNETLRQCRDGLILKDWVVIGGLLEGFECIVREISPQNLAPEYFNSALWFHRYTTGSDLASAVQLVWPGAVDGLFPWESGSSEIVCNSQPALYDRKLNS
ncbi:DUF4262 domain-containing protein [Sphingomonas sp. 37zxx]|uniref:DUF4262 domain-containing protein n=1 Tax=Sphingomonas sp. 37zxx TaxID=1550073 RepID=UPI00053BE289|nr:DUF4262 domain-containing protein [Sphingomonas sp. 37zxx]